jgi:hypothetical protein
MMNARSRLAALQGERPPARGLPSKRATHRAPRRLAVADDFVSARFAAKWALAAGMPRPWLKGLHVRGFRHEASSKDGSVRMVQGPQPRNRVAPPSSLGVLAPGAFTISRSTASPRSGGDPMASGDNGGHSRADAGGGPRSAALFPTHPGSNRRCGDRGRQVGRARDRSGRH